MSDAPEGYPKHIAHVNGLVFPKYERQEYPKWARHPDGAEKLVQSEAEEQEFMDQWGAN